MSDDCLFCRIASGAIPAGFIAETEEAVAFRDISPKAPVHVLVIPRKHISSLNEADDDQLLGRLLALAANVARDEGIAEGGYRTIINTRADGGQTVDHLHIHVMGGRHMEWPPG